VNKKFWVILLIALLTMALIAGCGGKKEEQGGEGPKEAPKTIVLRMGHVVQEPTAIHRAALQFAEAVKERTNGEVIIEVYPASQLGGNREMIESIQVGSLDFSIPHVSVISGFVQGRTAVFDLPYLFKNDAHAEAVLDGEVGQFIANEVKKSGIVVLAWWTQGWRHVTTGTRAVYSPEDMKGLKIRTMENPLHMAHFNMLGASAVPMAFSEVYTSLQQKVIDGQENPYVNIFTMGFYEVQPWITETGHIYDPTPLIMSEVTYNKLSPEHLKVIEEAAIEFCQVNRELSRSDAVEYKKVILGTGKNTIIELTPEQRQKFRDAVQKIYDDFADKELMNKVIKAGENF